MVTSQGSRILQHLRRASLLHDGAGLSDGQLVECFVEHGDQAAFAALVRRHGPMVWGVCRRLLVNHHDAEDAFQAAFLVLVRRAASVVPREKVANWLYGVAYHVAFKARALAARARRRERQVMALPEPAAVSHERGDDLKPLLDRELSRLPDKYRVPVVLCDLEGKTRKEAARQLGWPEGTVAGRLARARALLARRLARQGVALSGGLLAVALARNAAAACVPAALVSATIEVAGRVAAGPAAAGMVPARVAALTKGGTRTMLLTKLRIPLMALLAVAVVGFGGSALVYRQLQAATATGRAAKEDRRAPQREAAAREDRRQEEADRKGRVLFAHAPRDSAEPVRVASQRLREKQETLLFERPDRFQGMTGGFRISPDGKKVAYYVYRSTDDGPHYAMHVRNLDGAGAPVDMEADGQHVCWSPDGTRIAVSGGGSRNVIVDLKTRKQTVIELPEKYAVVDWSPDGTWFLVHVTTEKGESQLGRLKQGNAEVRVLAGTKGAFSGGRIAPDGKSILFDRLAGKYAANLYVLRLAGGEARQVTQELNCFVMGYSWSPSGRRIAYTLVRFDPDSAKDPRFEQETESFVTINDRDGKRPVTLTSGTTGGTSAVDYTLWDWR
jgi:RNA polymerase sigma factor (sigma-70 family)